ncbi:hypothetical protein BJY00DRAFT_274833 [Aspergillus carlsbadensis]|nr:hypothetical protein BJY00DRAFT_274833 [Aspergillus carlsbadensis]
MSAPAAKSDQRSNASERRQSGSSAAPQQETQNPDSSFNVKNATEQNIPEQDTEQNTPEQNNDLQEQEPQPLDREGEDVPSTPALEDKEPQTEQRDDNESQASGPAGSSGGSGIFGKLKSLGGGLTQQVSSTVKNVPSLATKPLDILRDLQVGEGGKIAGPDGNIIGRVVEGGEEAVGGTIQEGGKIVDQTGKTIGQAELTDEVKETVEKTKKDIPEEELEGAKDTTEQAKFEAPETDDVKDTAEEAKDDVYEDAEDAADTTEQAVDEAGDELPPLSRLEGLTCNKAGKIIDPNSGNPIGELVEGDPKKLSKLGSKLDDKGQFWDSRGNVIGKAKTIAFQDHGEEPPFAGLEDLHVVEDGFVEDKNGRRVGKLTEGDAKKLIGRPVDEDGDVTDQHGSVKGHAEPYEEPEEEQPEEEDLSILDGKTVNKAGKVVDEHGTVYGRVVEGDGKRLAGKKVDGKGQIWGDNGKVIGKAELIPGAEQEKPEGAFYGFENLTVGKDSVVQDGSGRTVGRVIEGDAAKLVGRKVDEDGDILDKNGNTIGRAERWEPEEKKRDVNPMAGRKITREGEVRDTDGNLIGKLTSGNLSQLVGKEIDDNGYVVDNDGNKIGEATLLEHIPEPEEPEPEPEPEAEPEGPSAEEQEAQKKEQEDKELAKKMSGIISQTLDRVTPICKMITEHVDKAEKTPKDELDEEQLVKDVKPLLEEANSHLQECNGAIRAMDPDGRIANNAKARAASHEASPEEYTLADKLKELTDTVVRTIDNGKKKINGMPHAKKELNPLWGLLSEPLFQIIAAVGLLLSGVLGLVGRLLEGLGLGPLVNGLLGGLGLDKLLSNLGLTSLTDSLGLTGKKKK